MPPHLFASLCCVVILPLCATAQDGLQNSFEVETLFRQAAEKYSAGNYAEALAVFDAIIQDYDLNQRTTASYIMKAKAHMRLDQLAEADNTLKTFLSLFPSSSYVPDARYTRGLIYLKIKRHEDAVSLFLAARHEASVEGKLADNLLEVLDRTFDSFLEALQIQMLISQAAAPSAKEYLFLKLSEKNIRRGNVTGAAEALDSLTLQFPHHPYQVRADAVRKALAERSSLKIGLIIPLMKGHEASALKGIAVEVYDGMMFALDEYHRNPATRVKVTAEVRDTERNPAAAERLVHELANDPSLVGLLGPVFSSEAAAASRAAQSAGIPLISPTANTNGLAETGEYVFQANPDYATRGRAMARYAMEVRGMHTFGILAPSDTYARQMAEAFAVEVRMRGGQVVATEWYQRGMTDLKRQLFSIRKTSMLAAADPVISFGGRIHQGDIAKLIHVGVPRARIDSLVAARASVSGRSLLGPNARWLIDSLGISAEIEDPHIDSLMYPVTTLDGLYLPIASPAEIGVISSQVVYFNFEAKLMGSGEWNDLTELDANKRYCTGVIFESDTYVDENSSQYINLYNLFYERHKKPPTKNTLYGFDCARMVMSLIHYGATSRQSLREALGGMIAYQGLHSKIGLYPNRVNSWLHVLEYNGESIGRIGEVNVNAAVP